MDELIEEIVRRRAPRTALLVGISGIDACGKGFVAAQLKGRLADLGIATALINVDGWLNLPHIRFDRSDPAGNFYHRGIRLAEMFRRLVLPLKQVRSLYLETDHTDETATEYRKHVYDFRDVEVILLEGIFLFKREYAGLHDLRVWIDCDFETALGRAVARSQEGLDPDATVNAYRTIYFPAQRMHFRTDDPRGTAHIIHPNF